MRRSRTLAAILACGFLGAAGAAGAGAGADEPFDRENPRNRRFEPPYVDFVTARPRTSVHAVGDRSAWPAGTEVTWGASAMQRTVTRLGTGGTRIEYLDPTPMPWKLDGKPCAVHTDRLFGDVDRRWRIDPAHVAWSADAGRHRLSIRSEPDDVLTVETDALKVLLLVEAKTLAAGDRRFGSFVRRFRKSLDDLHELFAASQHPLAPDGIVDRFRIDEVVVYERKSGVPPIFYDHPEFDVAIACDEGGPLAGFALPACSIGHDFTGPDAHHGLWSSWGEQALWHELLHFRGVQDFYLSEILDGALPGRWRGKLPLPKRYASDLMASPYQPPVLGEYTAVMANARQGVARVGACEETGNLKYGHVWNWLPPRLDLVVTNEGRPAGGARLRWWRARPTGPRSAPGVEAKAAPDGETVADPEGRAAIGGDLLGRSLSREERSLWLLVEVEVAGETRFEIVYGLDLNLAYARGEKLRTTIPLAFDRLLVRDGVVPGAR